MAALSPFALEGEHDQTGGLPAPMVDAVHRVTTDAARLTESWLDSLRRAGLSDECYVEALGVAVLVISIDEFHHAMGLPVEPLPEPWPGEPSHDRPRGLTTTCTALPLGASRVSTEIGAPSGCDSTALRIMLRSVSSALPT